jgi:hypothetical protein
MPEDLADQPWLLNPGNDALEPMLQQPTLQIVFELPADKSGKVAA